ncbi:type II toxin-antitoxin system RelE/ParE family toxin [[Actinomadura] parvosata]|uniref:type II toxin-antitoxin system RelE/ParE family toxin n=1 Tax=[Actinomadura] parvosata TaxID=1955412 RepID=UPI0009AD8505|nr:type II toxin-antitoxin system RelE/ParE family toxin [Nonomuraea sp. ATCC 55076]
MAELNDRRLNKVNLRREFFRVTPAEVPLRRGLAATMGGRGVSATTIRMAVTPGSSQAMQSMAYIIRCMGEELYDIELEPAVEAWLDTLSDRDHAAVEAAVERLAQFGDRMPYGHARDLGDGLWELRFDIAHHSVRLTYWPRGAGRCC